MALSADVKRASRVAPAVEIFEGVFLSNDRRTAACLLPFCGELDKFTLICEDDLILDSAAQVYATRVSLNICSSTSWKSYLRIFPRITNLTISITSDQLAALWQELASLQWNHLKTLVLYSGSAETPLSPIDGIESRFPKLRGLQVDCLCCCPFVNGPLWKQLDKWGLRYGSQDCDNVKLPELDIRGIGINAYKYLFSMLTPEQKAVATVADSPDGRRTQIQEAKNNMPYGVWSVADGKYATWWPRFCAEIQKNCTFELQPTDLAWILSEHSIVATRYDEKNYIDFLATLPFVPEKWWAAGYRCFEIAKEHGRLVKSAAANSEFWKYALSYNVDFVQEAVDICQTHAVSLDLIKFNLRRALQKEIPDIREETLKWLHQELQIHDACGVFYQRKYDYQLVKFNKDTMESVLKLTQGKPELMQEVPSIVAQKTAEFMTNKLPNELQEYYCPFSTTCRTLYPKQLQDKL